MRPRLKAGDLLWMRCLPGGICTFLEERTIPQPIAPDGPTELVMYKVLHPTMGVTDQADYYFESLEEAQQRSNEN